MKTQFLKLTFLIFLISVPISCSNDLSDEEPIELLDLKSLMTESLSHLAKDLRNNNENLSNTDFVNQSLKDYINQIDDSDTRTAAFDGLETAMLDNTKRSSANNEESLTPYVESEISSILSLLENSETLEEYLAALENKKKDIINSDFSDREKSTLIIDIIYSEVMLSFIDKNQDIFVSQSSSVPNHNNQPYGVSRWGFKKWFKCIGSIVVGKTMGAIAGCGTGAGVGAALGGPVGTVAGCLGMGYVGDVAGALGGAISGCLD